MISNTLYWHLFVKCHLARENICCFKVNIINIAVHWCISLCFLSFSGRIVPFARTASGVWVAKASSVYSANYWCIRSATNWYRNPAAMNRWSLYLKKKQMGRRQQSVSHHWLLSSRNRKSKILSSMGLVARYDLGVMVLVFKKVQYSAWQAGQSSCSFAVGQCMTSEE